MSFGFAQFGSYLAILLLQLFVTIYAHRDDGDDEYTVKQLTDIANRLESKDASVRRSESDYLLFILRPGKYDPNEVKVPLSPAVAKAHDRFLQTLQKALQDSDAEVRKNVAIVFANLGEDSKPAVPLLGDLLKDEEVKVRTAAARTLLELEDMSKEALPALKSAMNDKDKAVSIYSTAAVVLLGGEKEKAIRFILQFSTDKDINVRRIASRVFEHIGAIGIPFLTDGLKDKDPVVRLWTVGAFIQVMRKTSVKETFPTDATRLLIEAVADKDHDVTEAVIYALSDLGSRASQAVPAIIKRIRDPDWEIRWYAIHHISDFGSASETAIPVLKDALSDEKEIVRSEAKRALDSIEKAKKERAKLP